MTEVRIHWSIEEGTYAWAITRLRGRRYDWWLGATLIPTFHPAAALRGGERVKDQMRVSVGDNVLYSKFAGTEVKLDRDDYLVLSERDILAIVK